MSFFRNQILFRKKGFRNQRSYLFDGAGERININAVRTALATTTVGTWSCWVKPVDATPATTGMIINFGIDNNTDTIQLFILATTGTARIQFINNTTQWDLETNAAGFSDNIWSHLAIVQNAVSPVMYINGSVPAQTFITSTDRTQWFNNLVMDNARIGARFISTGADGNLPFNGNIDEVGFFNTNLTAAQITEIYNNGRPKDLNKHSANANLVSYFPFDGDPFDGTNFSVRDHKGNNHGVTVNMEYDDLELDVP